MRAASLSASPAGFEFRAALSMVTGEPLCDRLHYFRMPYCGCCHRSREEQPKRGSHSGSPVTIESAARKSNPAREALKDAARTLGLDLLFFNASTPKEIDAAFAAFAREKRYGGKTYPT